MTLQISSPDFAANGPIPRKHTCEGDDAAPTLEWRGAPAGTKSFALIVDDPDAPDPAAPKMVFVHWVAWDIPATATSIDGSQKEGKNDGGGRGYMGPCPPIGRHRYFFKLYALDTDLGDLGASTTKADLERAMKGHVLGQAELMGTYESSKAR